VLVFSRRNRETEALVDERDEKKAHHSHHARTQSVRGKENIELMANVKEVNQWP